MIRNEGLSDNLSARASSGISGGAAALINTFANIWAHDGALKVPRDDRPYSDLATSFSSSNQTWNASSSTITLKGAKNEVVSFAVVIENSTGSTISNFNCSFSTVTKGADSITSTAKTGNDVFNFVDRPIELFYMRYLPIDGLSQLCYSTYDERHVPEPFRLPHDATGLPLSGSFSTSTDANKFYPEICVPIEFHSNFSIAAGESQTVWCDITIPKTQAAGAYSGTFTVTQNGSTVRQLAVNLTVRTWALPDVPATHALVPFGNYDINYRLFNTPDAEDSTEGTTQYTFLKKLVQMMWRHKITPVFPVEYRRYVSEHLGSYDYPMQLAQDAMSGSLFSSANGYAGPGADTGIDTFFIGTYGSWGAMWSSPNQASFRAHMDAWENWFVSNANSVTRALWLYDESSDWATINTTLGYHTGNGGAGRNIKTFLTENMPLADANIPTLDWIASWRDVMETGVWNTAFTNWNTGSKKGFFYNGKRPCSPTFATEAEGTDHVALGWVQAKHDTDYHLFWNATYYYDNQVSGQHNDLWGNAKTFGAFTSTDSRKGKTGNRYTNGDGVLMYPATDVKALVGADNYGYEGWFTSMRMKLWRRGLQDANYYTLAKAINAGSALTALQTVITGNTMMEVGVDDPTGTGNGGTYKRAALGWVNTPDTYVTARESLATIIG